MSQIQISLEGASAIEVAKLLEGFPGYEVSFTDDSDGVVRGGKEKVACVLLTLKLLNAGVDTADNLLSFAEHVQNSPLQPVKSALIIINGQKKLLENATAAQILEVIRLGNSQK